MTSPSETCVWEQDEDGAWHAACGIVWEFITGGPSDNRATWCLNCGKRISEKPFDEAAHHDQH